jgi:hypothetical protein
MTAIILLQNTNCRISLTFYLHDKQFEHSNQSPVILKSVTFCSYLRHGTEYWVVSTYAGAVLLVGSFRVTYLVEFGLKNTNKTLWYHYTGSLLTHEALNLLIWRCATGHSSSCL